VFGDQALLNNERRSTAVAPTANTTLLAVNKEVGGWILEQVLSWDPRCDAWVEPVSLHLTCPPPPRCPLPGHTSKGTLAAVPAVLQLLLL
jgi:hypothetical protein